MITEDHVSFEIAKLLKEKGFEFNSCSTYYTLHGEVCEVGKSQEIGIAPRPTLQMAMKFLREKHIVIVPEVETFHADGSVSSWEYHIWCDDNYEEGQNSFSSYEEACEAAIRYCLENLI